MGYNLDFLDNDNELRSYFLGLYMADGWMAAERSFFISSIDKQIIDDLAVLLNYTNTITKTLNISTYNPDSKVFSYRIGFHKKELLQKIKDIGFANKKTGNEFIPDCISDETFHHFLRGFSDGDGHFSVCKQGNSHIGLEWGITCASKKLLEALLYKTREESICSYNKVSVRKRKDANCYRISFSHHDSVKIGDFIYTDASIYFARKYKKYLYGKSIVCNKNPQWTKRELEMAKSGVVPEGRTNNAYRIKRVSLK